MFFWGLLLSLPILHTLWFYRSQMIVNTESTVQWNAQLHRTCLVSVYCISKHTFLWIKVSSNEGRKQIKFLADAGSCFPELICSGTQLNILLNFDTSTILFMKWIFYGCRDTDGGKNTFVVSGVLFVTHDEKYFGQLVATLIL